MPTAKQSDELRCLYERILSQPGGRAALNDALHAGGLRELLERSAGGPLAWIAFLNE